MDDSYLIASHGRDGIYMATEIAPGGVAGTTICAESPSDLIAQIVQLWPADPWGITIYVGADEDLFDDLNNHLPAEYTLWEGRPEPRQTSYL
jgi:hypothetical protein